MTVNLRRRALAGREWAGNLFVLLVAAANLRGGLRDQARHRIHLRQGTPETTLCGLCRIHIRRRHNRAHRAGGHR